MLRASELERAIQRAVRDPSGSDAALPTAALYQSRAGSRPAGLQWVLGSGAQHRVSVAAAVSACSSAHASFHLVLTQLRRSVSLSLPLFEVISCLEALDFLFFLKVSMKRHNLLNVAYLVGGRAGVLTYIGFKVMSLFYSILCLSQVFG